MRQLFFPCLVLSCLWGYLWGTYGPALVRRWLSRYGRPDECGYDPRESCTKPDNPFWDGTDAAHPAWWRGEEYGSTQTARALKKIATTGEHKGVFGGREIEEAAQAILKARR